MKECSRRAWSSRKSDGGNAAGVRNGDSEISEVLDPCPPRYRRRESPGSGECGIDDDDELPKSSARVAASRYVVAICQYSIELCVNSGD